MHRLCTAYANLCQMGHNCQPSRPGRSGYGGTRAPPLTGLKGLGEIPEPRWMLKSPYPDPYPTAGSRGLPFPNDVITSSSRALVAAT